MTAVGREAASWALAPASSARSAGDVAGGRRARRERHAHRGGDADRGRAADRELADRRAQLGHRRAAPVDALAGQARLVEQDDRVVLEPDDVGGREHGVYVAAASACLSSAMRSISNGSTPAARAV